jgi:membrane associated rhomboid family serine protease
VCESLPNGDGFWKAGFSDGAWWQLLTSVFTHVEIWHLGMNMFALFIFGPILEGIVGRARFLAVYLLSGLASSVFVIYLSGADSSTVGASGAIFGEVADQASRDVVDAIATTATGAMDRPTEPVVIESVTIER